MSLQTILTLGVAIFLGLLAVVRTYPSRRWVTAILLLAPVLLLSIGWARYRTAWMEFGIGAGVAVAGLFIWWSLYGRKIPAPEGHSIRIWTEDDPF
jgi:hypothetical protein